MESQSGRPETGCGERVVVAMSGGVDSTVAAALLQRRGYDVIGMTLRLFDCDEQHNERSCCGVSGAGDALAAAGHLGIPHYVIDGRDLFDSRVLRAAWKVYEAGQTPNPCVACNEWLKFGLLFDKACSLDAQFVATGHHARVVRNGRAALCCGRDPNKDQSYFLFGLTEKQLSMALMPIGEMSKPDVRKLAADLALPNAERRESQDACIAQRNDMAEALRQRFGGRLAGGELVDVAGHVLGHHPGIHRFTVGQRKGLGIALGSRAYVVRIEPEARRVVVSTDEKDLLATELKVRRTQWHEAIGIAETRLLGVKVRYRQRAVPAHVTRVDEETASVQFLTAQTAVTPGQAAVFYDGPRVVGGGWIDMPRLESVAELPSDHARAS